MVPVVRVRPPYPPHGLFLPRRVQAPAPLHTPRYEAQRLFAGRHNRRSLDTEAMMAVMVRGMVGKHLPYATLIADGPVATAPTGDPF